MPDEPMQRLWAEQLKRAKQGERQSSGRAETIRQNLPALKKKLKEAIRNHDEIAAYQYLGSLVYVRAQLLTQGLRTETASGADGATKKMLTEYYTECQRLIRIVRTALTRAHGR